MVVALAQVNPVIGDLPGNVGLMRERIDQAREAGAQLVLFPELAVCGYPPADLLLRSDFLSACAAAAEEVAAAAHDLVVAFGVPLNGPRDLHNTLVVAAEGEIRVVYAKRHLPHYGTFDEGRYFGRGNGPVVVRIGDRLVGLCICADLWIGDGPATAAVRAGAELILNASASPFQAGKARDREAMLSHRARELVCPIAYANCWGGHDELVFDGGSTVVDHRGRVVARAEHFAEELLLVPLDLRPVRAARLRDPRLRAADETAAPSGGESAAEPRIGLPLVASQLGSPPVAEMLDPHAELWLALRLGIADQAVKNGLDHAVVGLGGGIDSSLVAVLACEALGPERVTAVLMPAADNDRGAEHAARELAAALGCELREVPVAGLRDAYEHALGAAALSSGAGSWSTEERVLARIRSNLLMALANLPGRLLLSTGNKSELACGYATLYGETFGGFAPLKDVPRTTVVRLARWRQGSAPGPIPAAILRDPHGGVRPSAWRQDGLPPFDVVDPILQAYVEEDEDPADLVARGHDPGVVRRVVDLVERAEPKRRQAPPGIRISARAFGQDRRMPLVHRFRATGATTKERERSAGAASR
ncbi:MAG: NAD+ synthase [Actinobacteria bacterium]|nr:NAD+ synthase [Actinomycetota bacterium]